MDFGPEDNGGGSEEYDRVRQLGETEMLFDDYSDSFDEHLRLLDYRAPDLLLELLLRLAGGDPAGATAPHWARAIDLGSGTGLGGAAVRSLVERLEVCVAHRSAPLTRDGERERGERRDSSARRRTNAAKGRASTTPLITVADDGCVSRKRRTGGTNETRMTEGGDGVGRGGGWRWALGRVCRRHG